MVKKHIFIIGITFVLLIVGLSGCTETYSKIDFEGTWLNTATKGNKWKSIELHNDGTANLTYWNNNNPGNCTWDISDDKLLVINEKGEEQINLSYEFKDKKTLVLSGTPENLVLTGDGTYKKQ
jgi:hypothetical protein